MGLKINTNLDSLNVQRQLSLTNQRVSGSLQRLSSGLRINSAKDDSAGFATANAFKAKISSMRVASQNATEAQAMLQTADGAYTQIHDIMIRMKDLATQAASDQTGTTNLTTMNQEFEYLQSEIDRIAASTKYGSTLLVNGTGASSTGITFQVGATNDGDNQLALTFSGATGSDLSVNKSSIDISTAAKAQSAMDAIDTALTSVNGYMGKVGAYQNRLQYTINNLATSIENFSASESSIRDVDMAYEVTQFTKNQILQQSGMSMLAQANAAPQQILTLLR